MLRMHRVSAGYGALEVLREVDLEVAEGEWVALVGAVGAGKTTLMRTIAGSLEPRAGKIELEGDDITFAPAYDRVRRGVSLVPEGRRLFRGMTVDENLHAGAHLTRRRRVVAERMERVLTLFPILAERSKQQVGTLSGGEQQMCAIGRALMSGPRLLLVDELSLGLAPVVVDALLEALVRVREEGTTLLVVEQDIETSLEYADRGYLLRHGEMVAARESKALLADPGLRNEFMGVT